MNISGIGSQLSVQDVSGNKRLEIKSTNTVGWEDFQARVKTQVQSQQNENSVALVKNTADLTEAPVKTEEEKQAEADQMAARGQTDEAELGANNTDPAKSRGGTIDKVV